MKDFEDKVAVVTGAASGIGRALALDFARRGMRVVLADVDAEGLAIVRREVEAAGAACLTRRVDVAVRQQVLELAETTYERFGAAHVLCNNAGVMVEGRTQHATHAEWEWVLSVNVGGVVFGVEAFLPRMLEGGTEGHIVNTASMAGMIPFPHAAVYNTSKSAVVGLTESLGRDLRGTAIGVSLLCPFWVRTAIFRSGARQPPSVERPHPEIDMSALPEAQWKTPEQVSAMVLEAIGRKRFYIFTHPETREYMEARIAGIQAAYPR